ncbi:MAG: polyphenol oxidase family protein [Nitriliruptoraceae bacterium]
MSVHVEPVDLVDGVIACFTGRDKHSVTPTAGVHTPGNVSHARPHSPSQLAQTRNEIADHVGVPVARWHFMRQVHGADVAIVTATTPLGMQLDAVDAAVTVEADRCLVVQVADCVPVLLAATRTGAVQAIGVVHAGRVGLVAGVVEAATAALQDAAGSASTLHAAVGPAIGGCCYEVPDAMHHDVAQVHPAAAATTTWGSPALDLPAAVVTQLIAAGVQTTQIASCTRCDPEQRWFSHRTDPTTGRFVGMIAMDKP